MDRPGKPAECLSVRSFQTSSLSAALLKLGTGPLPTLGRCFASVHSARYDYTAEVSFFFFCTEKAPAVCVSTCVYSHLFVCKHLEQARGGSSKRKPVLHLSRSFAPPPTALTKYSCHKVVCLLIPAADPETVSCGQAVKGGLCGNPISLCKEE